MTSDLLFNKIVRKALKKEISLNSLEKNTYYIDEKNTNRFLNILFKEFRDKNICFSILRDEACLIKIYCFREDFITPDKYFLYTKRIDEISNEEKADYKKEVTRLQKLKISPIIGPDGVGKTTLLTTSMENVQDKILYKRFKKIVRRSVIYNIMYPINKLILKKKLGRKPLKDQHDDKHYLLILLAGILYYPYLMYNAVLKKRVVFVDRFFYDYLLENISFKEKKTVLRINWKNLLRYIPKVYWNIHLDARAKVILNRKDELTKRDIKKYRRYNFKLYLQKPSIVYSYINTGLDLKHCQKVLLYIGEEIGVIHSKPQSSSKVVLDKSLLIAKGGERACYIDPKDDTKVIKVLYSQGVHNDQNKLEQIYMDYLEKQNTDLSHLTRCYGYIDTSLGEGLVFDRAVDYDGEPSKSFRYYLANKLISEEYQKELLEELRNYLEKNSILFIDTSLTNIFAVKISEEKYKLIIVDGLGAKRMGMKFWLYRNSKLYTKYKIKRQWEKLMKMYDKDIKRVHLGKRPFTRL